MEEIRILVIWLQARCPSAQRDERGFTAVEWLLIALGVITIAGIAVAAIKAYVTGQTNKLGAALSRETMRRARRTRDERGALSIEFLLVISALMLVFLLMLQYAVKAHAHRVAQPPPRRHSRPPRRTTAPAPAGEARRQAHLTDLGSLSNTHRHRHPHGDDGLRDRHRRRRAVHPVPARPCHVHLEGPSNSSWSRHEARRARRDGHRGRAPHPGAGRGHHRDRRRLALRRCARPDQPRGVRRRPRSLADDQPRGRRPGRARRPPKHSMSRAWARLR